MQWAYCFRHLIFLKKTSLVTNLGQRINCVIQMLWITPVLLVIIHWPLNSSAFPQNVLSSYLQNTAVGRISCTIKKWKNRSLPSRSLHLNRYVNKTGSFIKKKSYCPPTFLNTQVSNLNSWLVLSLSLKNLFTFSTKLKITFKRKFY